MPRNGATDPNDPDPQPRSTEPFRLVPIGHVRRRPSSAADDSADIDTGADTDGYTDRGPAELHIAHQYRDGLLHLQQFSHVMVLWWAQRHDNDTDRPELRVYPRPAPHHLMGVFATRSPARPNPVAVTVCRLRSVDEATGIVHVDDLDAADGTPIIDLKPYLPSNDRVRRALIPEWFPAMPEWACEEAEPGKSEESAGR